MKTLLATISLSAALGAGAAGAATLVNGSFESPDIAGSYVELAAGSSALTGWTVGGGGVDHINSYWTAQDGGQSVDLNRRSAGSLSQMVTDLIVGVTYDLTFWMAGNPAGGPSVKSLTATLGGTGDYFFDIAGATFGNMNWEMKTLTFTATDTLQLLTFASNNTGAYGPALDNVRITEASLVPLPAAGLLLIAALGGLAAVRRRTA